MTYANILVSRHDKVGFVTLNRPQALNALIDELALALDDFEADEAIGCIVLVGSEKVVAAGTDISASWRWPAT